MKNAANEEFLSDSEMQDIENVMTARYALNTDVCKNYSHVRILSRPNGRFLKRLRFAPIVLKVSTENYPGYISLDTIKSTE